MFTGRASRTGSASRRPPRLARLEVEPPDLLGAARLRRAAPSAAAEGRDRALERDAVVGLERRRLAPADGAVARLQPQQHELALAHHAARRDERPAERDGQAEQRAL